MSKVLDNELLLEEEIYNEGRILDPDRCNEVAGLIETIKAHEQEIVDLRKERDSLKADLAAKDLFIKAQSSLHEELKRQVIDCKTKIVHAGSMKDFVTETEGGHEQ